MTYEATWFSEHVLATIYKEGETCIIYLNGLLIDRRFQSLSEAEKYLKSIGCRPVEY